METTSIFAATLYYVLLIAPIFFFAWYVKHFIESYKGAKRAEAFHSKERIVLEIRIPKEVNKTPLAMELFFNAINDPSGDASWWLEWTKGTTRPISSFEIASIEGSVHFYIWLEKSFRTRYEANLYAQYPDIELVEVPDYTKFRSYDPEKDSIFGFEFGLAKEDPVPIKTYKHFLLDSQGTKEEFKVDPISQTLESLASVGPGEQMWMQIVIRAHKDEIMKSWPLKERLAWKELKKHLWPWSFVWHVFFTWEKGHNWKTDGKKLFDDLKDKYTSKKDEFLPFAGAPSKEDKLFAEELQENLNKPAFDCGLRTIYIADKDNYKPGERINVMGSMFKAYSTGLYNSFKPILITGYDDHPWLYKRHKALAKMKQDIFNDYKRRKYFFAEKEYAYGKVGYPLFVLSSEELATIYHIPGSVVQTPTFERLGSTTSEAPKNLPIGPTPDNLPT